jgi:uncharacterized protein YndB with AHSA1/START domain
VARTTVRIPAPLEAVWATIIDPTSYPEWLIGADHMRDVDDAWPAVGARFHHTVGFGPLKVRDHSTLRAIEPMHRLVLGVRATVVVQAEVTFRLRQVGDETELELQEEPDNRAGELLRPVLDPMTHGRNQLSLERLRDVVARRAGTSPA